MTTTHLRFNFGFLLDGNLGDSRIMELDYPSIQLDDVTLAPLKGQFKVSRTSNGLFVHGKLQSDLNMPCARCLTPITYSLTMALDDLFHHPPKDAPAGAMTIRDNGMLDLGPLVRELSLLDLPIRQYCQPNCQGICSDCGLNLNEGHCTCAENKIDPRLAALKALLDT